MRTYWMMAAALGGALGGSAAHAERTVAPGYAVETVTTPGVVQGGVVKQGKALIVGQGDFGPGLESIVRLEAGRATTIATGFGGLGGFDLAPDGTLYVVDNCYTQDFGCDAATTGDTVYAIPDALTRTTPLAAADAELLPAGSIPFPFDVLSTPLGLLVSDAAGPGSGRVVRIEGSAAVDLVTGLDYAGGLAFADLSLYVANVGADFSGDIREFVDGTLQDPLIAALSGAAGLAVDCEGNLLLGAGAALLEVDAAGEATPLVEGLGFVGDVFYDATTDETLFLDFGATAVTVVCRDADGDGTCDGTCDGAPLEEARLTLSPGKPLAGSLRFRAHLYVEGGLTADPSTDGMRVRLLDGAGRCPVRATIPGGPMWRARRHDRGWRFRDEGSALGITDVKITPARNDDEEVKVTVRSRRRLAADLTGLELPLRMSIALGSLDQCGWSAFGGCETRKNRVICE